MAPLESQFKTIIKYHQQTILKSCINSASFFIRTHLVFNHFIIILKEDHGYVWAFHFTTNCQTFAAKLQSLTNLIVLFKASHEYWCFKTRAILSKGSLKRSATQSNIKTIEIPFKETTRVRFEYVWSQYGNCLQ